MTVELALIEFIYHGRVAPLTKLEWAKNGQPGTFDGGVYYGDGRVCEMGLQIKSLYNNEPIPFPVDASAEKVAGRHFFGGMLQGEHFGHFMAESLTRLWAARQLASMDSVVFYLRDATRPIAGFVRDMLALLMPNVPITVVSALTEFEVLAVPKQIGAQYGGFIYGHPVIRDLFGRLPYPEQTAPQKIYVSRSHLTAREGGILLEHVIEANLQAEGYTIVHPQEMSIRQQIDFYRTAEELIFADGSALHLYAVLARPHQRAFVIWRRKKNDGFDWQIQSFGGKATAGVPCIRSLWVPEKDPRATVQAQATLDFVALRNQLQAAGFIQGDHWRVPTAAEFDEGLDRARARMKTDFVPYPLDLISPNLVTSSLEPTA